MKNLIMKAKTLGGLIIRQFKTHTAISFAITAAVVCGIVLVCIFTIEKWDYLPNRAYILASEAKEPETLYQLLHSEMPDIETFLRNPDIAQELLAAEQLTDIVDSRLALNNLRELSRQLSIRLEENDENIGTIEQKSPASATQVSYENSSTPVAIQASITQTSSGKINNSESAFGLLGRMHAAINTLIDPPTCSDEDLVTMEATITLKGIWQNPGEISLHMIPEGDWLPDNGYTVSRIIDGQAPEIIVNKAAAAKDGLNGEIGGENNDIVQTLYQQAQLTQEKLSTLGVTATEFRETAYRYNPLSTSTIIDGTVDFQTMREQQITIPSDISQRMPATDQLLSSPITVIGPQAQMLSQSVNSGLSEQFPYRPSKQVKGIDRFMMAGDIQYDTAEEILSARQQLSTLSFVDSEFAEEAEFLIHDDLSGRSIPDGTQITYVVNSGGTETTLQIVYGSETNLTVPQGLNGYGYDGLVALRWDEIYLDDTANPMEQGIISGFHIERKLNGESGFTRITTEPVVISYALDELGWLQSPIFYQDEVENGRTAEYRICAIDIFGRTSGFSQTLTIDVEKITPPNAPSIVTPEYVTPVKSPDMERTPVYQADSPYGDINSAKQNSVKLNSNKDGVVLPIFTDSADTVRFTIYRAVSVGAGTYGTPEPIANLDYDNPQVTSDPGLQTRQLQVKTITKRLNGARQIKLSSASTTWPDLVYFDSDVEEGCSYKYWVSAWDEERWNNESAFSQSVSIAIPIEREPAAPDALDITMYAKKLPSRSKQSPGIIDDSVTTESSMIQLGAGVSFTTPMPNPASEIAQYSQVNDMIVQLAETSKASIGKFMSENKPAEVISNDFNNLPEQKYLHAFLAVPGESVWANGDARLTWIAYSGEGLAGYNVYRAGFAPLSLEEMQAMTRDELMQLGNWQKINTSIIHQNNYTVSNLQQAPDSLNLFLICLQPTASDDDEDAHRPLAANLFSGYVHVSWEIPEDPQVKHYRVYRSEVPSFKNPVDEATLEWTMIGDLLRAPQFTEPVEQSHAHYYYYKVTSVSPWGVETAAGTVQRFRVPSTLPPATPALFIPLQRKDGVQVNFSAVQYCDRYILYRTEIPRVNDKYLAGLNDDIKSALFSGTYKGEILFANDEYLSELIDKGLDLTSGSADGKELNPIARIKTLQYSEGEALNSLRDTSTLTKLEAFTKILDDLGPLALSEYNKLSTEMMSRVPWEEVGRLEADYDTVEEVADASTGVGGMTKPLSIMDESAEYGKMYLYTVQAWNDDNLGSTRPEPVEATPRRSGPFDPIEGLNADITQSQPSLTWNTPTQINLNHQRCLDETVGYIVYRSDQRDGEYYQASPLVFEPRWIDKSANPFANNWYRVKVLDTGGYLSEYSEPLLVERPYVTNLIPTIPQIEMGPAATAPSISFSSSTYYVESGSDFQAPYTLTGTEPVTVTITATNSGSAVSGFTVNATGKTVNAPGSLAIGTYTVTAKAENIAGESTSSFTLKVEAAPTVPVRTAPRITKNIYKNQMTTGTDYTAQFAATGSEPLTWALQSIVATTHQTKVPDEASINNLGILTIRGSIAPGEYKFIVLVYNDLGKDSFEFSITVQQGLILQPGLRPRGEVGLTSATGVEVSNLTITKTSLSQSGTTNTRSETLLCGNFQLKKVNLSRTQTNLVLSAGLNGTAQLDLGYQKLVPVMIANAVITNESGTPRMTSGTVYLDALYNMEDLGITLASLAITPADGKALVSGYVESTVSDQNLLGNIGVLEFTDADLNPGSIMIQGGLPDICYDQFTFHPALLHIFLNGNAHMFEMTGGTVALKAPLETMNNEGAEFIVSESIRVDKHGEIIGGRIGTQGVQSLQMLVPGGTMLRIDNANLTFRAGGKAKGELKGRLILPFEHTEAMGEYVTAAYADHHPDKTEMDQLYELYVGSNSDRTANADYIDNDEFLTMSLDSKIYYFGQRVQQNALLIVPDDAFLQDKCSHIMNLEIHDWDGKGFTTEGKMTTTRITNRNLATNMQRTQAIILDTRDSVLVDLNRNSHISPPAALGQIEPTEYETKESMLPKETQQDFWVGLVIQGGKLSLPADYVKPRDPEINSISFNLAPGEMIYDLNGFSYQTYMHSEAGAPIEFRSNLGSFEEVLLKDVLLDMYANRVNLEMNVDVMLELFNYEWVHGKLYTNKEDNADGVAGEFLCSVTPITLENATGTNMDIVIDGGFFRSDGLHVNGNLTITTPEVQTHEGEPLAFTNMIVPKHKEMTSLLADPDRKFGNVQLDKPTVINFKSFTMEVRQFDLECLNSPGQRDSTFSTLPVPFSINISGSTLLSDNIPLGQETTDLVTLDYAAQYGSDARNIILQPLVQYEESFSELGARFDDMLDVTGKLVPHVLGNLGIGEGLIEFETENLTFGMLEALNGAGVKTTTRFGFDIQNTRCYFVIGVTPDQGKPVDIGIAKIENFAALLMHNMEPPTDLKQTSSFPRNEAELTQFVKDLPVHRGANSVSANGVICDIVVGDMAKIKDAYLYIASGPIMSANGELWAKTDFRNYKLIAGVSLCYSHPERYLSASITLSNIPVMGLLLSGSIGFEAGTKPMVFGVYIGYPHTLKVSDALEIVNVGAGFAFQITDGDDTVQIKVEGNADVDADIEIVYVKGYLRFLASGLYIMRPNNPDALELILLLKGELKGGIRAFGKTWNIIHMHTDANGLLTKGSPTNVHDDTINLKADVEVGYHLNVFIGSIGGTKTFHFSKTL